MLDDNNIIKQRDPSGALQIAANQFNQASFSSEIKNNSDTEHQIYNIVIAGMGGSALAALLVNSWLKLDLRVPIEIVRGYNLPNYVGEKTLVIASSYSGNTEETVSCLGQAKDKNAQIAIIASGGKLLEEANNNNFTYINLPSGMQPRMAVIYNLRALVSLLVNFKIVDENKYREIEDVVDWLGHETAAWSSDVPTDRNYAKQIANFALGKTAVFYGGAITASIAYKWKISWNENAKNVAFWNELPEFNHNEFIGWTSHPVEKPFAAFDIVSNFEHSQILKRFEVSDRLLSGKRPKSFVINLAGDSVIKQLLWGSILADYASIYLAILNGVDPTPVNLIENLKKELS